jgi:hypothetical protein
MATLMAVTSCSSKGTGQAKSFEPISSMVRESREHRMEEEAGEGATPEGVSRSILTYVSSCEPEAESELNTNSREIIHNALEVKLLVARFTRCDNNRPCRPNGEAVRKKSPFCRRWMAQRQAWSADTVLQNPVPMVVSKV